MVSTSRPLELLHIDLFGPISTPSLAGKKYYVVVVDDFYRFTWTLLLAHKDETFSIFSKICRRIQNEKGFMISNIRTYHGRELDNDSFEKFCDQHGYGHNFSAPRTPQQNGFVERKIVL